MACFALDEFEAAREAFRAGLALEPNNTTLRTWLRKCEAELAGEEGLEAEASGAPVPALAQTESSTPTTSATPTTTTATPANSASTTVIPPKEPKVKYARCPLGGRHCVLALTPVRDQAYMVPERFLCVFDLVSARSGA